MSIRNLINQLIQLQELIIARLQKKASMPNAHLDALDKSIQQLSKNLPPKIKTHLNRLLQRHPEAIVPIIDGICTGCGMELTQTLIIEVHRADELYRCPHCTRYLYSPSEIVAKERKNRVYGERQPKGIMRFSAPSLMVVPLKGNTPETVLEELCARLQTENFIEDKDQLLKLFLYL